MEEYKMYQDNTTRMLFDYIVSEIFKGTPIEKTIIGTELNIRKFTKTDVTNFRSLYTLENSLLVVSGNFDKNAIINSIKNYSKDCKFNHSKNIEPEIKYNITSSKPNVYIIPNKNSNQSYMFISFYFNKLSLEDQIVIIKNINIIEKTIEMKNDVANLVSVIVLFSEISVLLKL